MKDILLKNKVIKTFLSLILVSILLINSSTTVITTYAEEVDNTASTDTEEVDDVTSNNIEEVDNTLTLEKAIEIAKENNYDLKIAEADKVTSTYDVDKQKKLAKLDSETGSYDADLAIEIAKVNKKYSKDLIEANYKVAEINLELSVKKAYYQLIHAKELLDLSKQLKQQADESYNIAKSKYDLGQISVIELTNAETEVANKEAELIQSEINYKQKLMDLNQVLNQDLQKEWEINDTIDTSFVVLPDMETVRDYMNENHPLVLSSNLRFTIAKTTFELASGFYPPIVWTYKYAEQDYNKAKYEFESAKVSQEKNLINAYLGIEGSVKSITALEKSAESMRKTYEISKTRYELGSITSSELNEALLGLKQIETNLLNAKLNYRISVATLEYISAYKLNTSEN